MLEALQQALGEALEAQARETEITSGKKSVKTSGENPAGHCCTARHHHSRTGRTDRRHRALG